MNGSILASGGKSMKVGYSGLKATEQDWAAMFEDAKPKKRATPKKPGK